MSKFIFSSLILLVSTASYAAIPEVISGAKQFLQQEIGTRHNKVNITMQKLDSRIKVKSCSLPIEYNLNSIIASRTIITASCAADPKWQLHLSANVQIFEPVVTAHSAISRGETLSKSKLQLKNQDVLKLIPGYFNNLNEVIGTSAKTALAAGQILQSQHIAKIPLIQRGATVEIIASGESIQIRSEGIALEDGYANNKIRIKNLQSKRIITAEVVANNQVQVSF